MKHTIISLLTLFLLASAFALASPASPARADGIIIIDPPICIKPCPFPPLHIPGSHPGTPRFDQANQPGELLP